MIHTVLYVAASEATAADGANALERAGSRLAVEPAVDAGKIRAYAPGVDCVVFAETPTTPQGAHLLEVIETCEPTPVVLYADATFGPTAARSTDGVAGYVRRDGDGSVTHLADEVAWVCHERDELASASHEPDEPGEVDEPASTPAESAPPGVDTLCELTTWVDAPRDERQVLERMVALAVDVLAADAAAVLAVEDGRLVTRARTSGRGDHSGSWPVADDLGWETLESGEPVAIDDVRERSDDAATSPVIEEGTACRSVLSVPVGNLAVLQAVAERPDAFDAPRLEFAVVVGSYVAESVGRLRAEAALRGDRERFEALFDRLPEPAVHYEVVDGTAVVRDVNERFETTFGDRLAVAEDLLERIIASPGGPEEGEHLPDRLPAGPLHRAVIRRETAAGVRDFLVHAVPLESGPRAAEGVVRYTDVTERNRRERRLAARKDRLEAVTQLVDDELRPSLNVARGYLELATETGDPEHFAEIEAAHERLGERLEGLLGLARRDEAIDELEPVAIHDAATRAWAGVDTREASLELEGDGIVQADRSRLVEAFESLVRTALVHHVAEGPLGVRVGVTDDGFFLAADGVALPRNERERALDGGDPAVAEETGHGFETAERIVEAHDWTLEPVETDGCLRFAVRGASVDGLEEDADSNRNREFTFDG